MQNIVLKIKNNIVKIFALFPRLSVDFIRFYTLNNPSKHTNVDVFPRQTTAKNRPQTAISRQPRLPITSLWRGG